MTEMKRWNARIDWRVSYDTRKIENFQFDEFDELGEYIESGPNFYAFEKIVITALDPRLATTLERELLENGDGLDQISPPSDTPTSWN